MASTGAVNKNSTSANKTGSANAQRRPQSAETRTAKVKSAERPNPQFKRSPQLSGRPDTNAQRSRRPNDQRNSQQKAATKRRRRRRKNKAPIIALTAVVTLVTAVVCIYFAGYFYYKDKFTANTYVNGVDVSGKTFEEAAALFAHNEIPDTLQIIRPSGDVINISMEAIDYSYSYENELRKIYNDLDKKSWFAFMLRQTDYKFSDVASYDKSALIEQMELSDWGDILNENAKIKSNDDGYYVVPEVQGDVFDMETLQNYVIKCLDKATYTVVGVDSGAYVQPDTVTSDYDAKIETLNKMWNTKIFYNFDYTKEKLTGKTLCKLINVKRDGSYTVDEDACMKYVEKLAKKYDTYNTERKFHATIQGDIVVPTSSDAKYGWWLDQQQTCDQLVDMLKKGKTKKNVKPIYYAQGNFEFTGLPEARSKNDDIGDTYLEVDLTNQQFWYYKNGKKKRSGYIVSGQTTSAARTTLPGVYKVWQKATNYRMKDSNADGDEWDTTCNYWTRIAIVGIGMHDSTWRGAFGGEIYKYNGSHGCINMTYSDAQFIYESVAMGTPVVMYY